jgi:hypothetical protein
VPKHASLAAVIVPGRAFSPERLAGDFGAETALARDGIHALYEAIRIAADPKAQTCFRQWKTLFSEVCGCEVDEPSEKIKKLAAYYGVGSENLKPAELLFAVHSYYAIFVKLLAAEVVAFAYKLPSPLQGLTQAAASAEFMRIIEDLETGSFFHRLNIGNLLDGDLFAWYAAAWSEPIERLVRGMAARLASYDPAALSRDPAESRDLLKTLYQQLFPKGVRRGLGEYYTPDWLAEHVLSELGYVGDPDKRILDPACGSGTFLVAAINRIRRWYDEHRATCGFGESELCRRILDNVVGFDLSPLAVMAARTNYLIAIRDLIGRMDRVEIPVYLCDSILTPSEHSGLFSDTSLDNGKGPSARLAGQVDYVAGNPPWIVWDNLPADYRHRTKPLWKHYGLFTLSAAAARHGGGKKDLSMLMLYANADAYLKQGGKLGFVITQTLFQTKGAGDGFRRFRIGAAGQWLRVLRVDDMVGFQPFPGASNWTSTIILEKGRETVYPVPYYRWSLVEDCASPSIADWAASFDVKRCDAEPIDRRKVNSPWLIRPKSLHADLGGLVGPSDYVAHSGACSGGANGVYWLQILKMAPGGALVQNLAERSKTSVATLQRTIEPDLLYPLLRWGGLSRFRASPSDYLLLAQDPETRTGIDESIMRQSYPRAYAYLQEFRENLQRRAAYKRYQSRSPFYSMYDVGTYTLAPTKVVWRRMDRRINAAVVEETDDPHLGLRPVIPQETCVLIQAQSSAEAHYLCAVLNSAAANFIVQSHSVRGGKGFGTPSMLDYLALRRFQPTDPLHKQLAGLSQTAHSAVAAGEKLDDLQLAIDRAAADLFGVPRDQLAAIRKSLD